MADGAPKRVLIVEDEWIIADGLAATLENAGYVVVGPTGRLIDAFQLIATESIDAALIDINLQGDRSFGLAKKLTDASIPFAFLSGYSRTELPRGLGEKQLLQKPVAEAAVRLCVDELLRA